jgi:hypothetical protein
LRSSQEASERLGGESATSAGLITAWPARLVACHLAITAFPVIVHPRNASGCRRRAGAAISAGPTTSTSSTLRLPIPTVNTSVDITGRVASLRGYLTRTPARIVSAMP